MINVIHFKVLSEASGRKADRQEIKEVDRQIDIQADTQANTQRRKAVTPTGTPGVRKNT